MKKYYFSLILSQDNVFKSICLYISLKKYCNNFKLYILCMNDSVYKIFNEIGFENVVPVELRKVEKNDKRLLEAKSNRIFHEYCWTLKSTFLLYVINHYKDADYYAHVDADLFFFDKLENIFNESPQSSIFLTHHRNAPEFEHFYNLSGLYNTGFVGFRNCDTAKKAAELWSKRCLKKCTVEYDTINKTFGDQRYVEEWPAVFKNVHIVNSRGVNAAMWNIQNYKVSKVNDEIYVDNFKLIFYHFSGLSIIGENEFDLCPYYHIDDENIINHIYKPYVIGLVQSIKNIKKYFPWFNNGFVDKNLLPNLNNYKIML